MPTNLVGGTSFVVWLNFSAPQSDGLVLDFKPLGAPRNATNRCALWLEYQRDGDVPSRSREGVMTFDGTRGDLPALVDDGHLMVQASSSLGVVRNSFSSLDQWVTMCGIRWSTVSTTRQRASPPSTSSESSIDLTIRLGGASTAAWMTFAFEVSDPSALTLLSLRMQYDDGFVAYHQWIGSGTR